MTELFKPLQIIWHVGNVCNSNCTYCFTSSDYSDKEISNKSWKRVVEEINKQKSIKRVSIIGGEPLLIKELPKIIENLREDIIINVDSNLTIIREKWSDSFKKVYFCTTIDSIDEDIHQKTRTHSVRKTIEGIKFLLGKGVKVSTVIVVNKHNVNTLNNTARFLFKLGIDKISISRVRMYGRALKMGYNYFYDDIEEIKQKTLQTVKELIKDYSKEKIILYNFWFDERFFNLGYEYEPSCRCALFKACIDWEGYVYPCELMPFYWEQFYEFYNLERPNLNGSGLSEIFQNSKLFKFFRDRMLYYPIGCEFCSYKEDCNHGCRFYSFLISGILSSKDIMCGCNSVYDVLGYHYYSPLSPIGKSRLNSETEEFIKMTAKELGKNVYDLGCGGGLWSFFLEGLQKEVIGIDNNKTMLVIADEYKKLKNKKSQFVLSNLLKYRYAKVDSAIMLDNVISAFSKKDFIVLLKKLKGQVKKVIIEINKNELKEGEFNYNFNDFDIREIVKKRSKDIYERFFFNKQTGASFTILSYFWNLKILKKILKEYGKITSFKETKNSYLLLIELI